MEITNKMKHIKILARCDRDKFDQFISSITWMAERRNILRTASALFGLATIKDLTLSHTVPAECIGGFELDVYGVWLDLKIQPSLTLLVKEIQARLQIDKVWTIWSEIDEYEVFDGKNNQGQKA